MDKFVADCKTVSSFLFGLGVVSQYGRVYFDSPEVAKVLGNVEYKEAMLLKRDFTRIIKYHTFVIRRRAGRKHEYILLCKVNEAEAVLVTPDYETVLKANEEYTNMVKVLEGLDCYEPVTLKFPRTNIWGRPSPIRGILNRLLEDSGGKIVRETCIWMGLQRS